MNITFVVDTYGPTTNGTTITAMRTAHALRDRGHRVNIITGTDSDEDNVYVTGIRKTPFLYQLCNAQGMLLARTNRRVLRKVIRESDIVHFLLPFKIEKVGKRLADAAGIPSSAAFHVQPENITSSVYLDRFQFLNKMIYLRFKKFYNRFAHIHCPSTMIAEQLKKYAYSSMLHVISNGVCPQFKPIRVERPAALDHKFIILMIGRFSREKRQDLIIDAVTHSAYEKDIQLIFAGQGPWKKTLQHKAEKLTHPPIMDFFDQKSLIEIINYADLYVHASDVEIEAISCIEAFSCGLVPIISDSVISATNQFALSRDNLFKARNPLDLSKKIDRFLSNPQKLKQASQHYIDYAEQFSLIHTVDQLEQMFIKVIEEHKGKIVLK